MGAILALAGGLHPLDEHLHDGPVGTGRKDVAGVGGRHGEDGSGVDVLGDDVVHAEAGDLVFKPRDQWHTFWNAGEQPCRILELIAPGGFEAYFDELAELTADGGEPPLEEIGALGARYGLEFDPSSIEQLCREHGLSFPG